MSRMISLLIISAVILSGCYKTEEKSAYLEDIPDVNYRVKISHLYYNSEIDEGFEIYLESDKTDKSYGNTLRVEQCKNIKMIREKNEINLFYDFISIVHFTNYKSTIKSLPPIYLCDINNKYCNNLLKEKIDNGLDVVDICIHK